MVPPRQLRLKLKRLIPMYQSENMIDMASDHSMNPNMMDILFIYSYIYNIYI